MRYRGYSRNVVLRHRHHRRDGLLLGGHHPCSPCFLYENEVIFSVYLLDKTKKEYAKYYYRSIINDKLDSLAIETLFLSIPGLFR